MRNENLIIVRGGGDIATGTIHRLFQCGFKVLVLETNAPAAIRRQVSFCEAVYEGCTVIEGVEAVLVNSIEMIYKVISSGKIPVYIDPEGKSIKALSPYVVVDAILAKKNIGTTKNMAPLTIGLGPGFVAGGDVDYVIETMRGHNLGRIISEGSALANTGVPGSIGGYSKERVMYSPARGTIRSIHKIGDIVMEGDIIAVIEGEEETSYIRASITGIIRGLIRDCYFVSKGLKVADIDPRKSEIENCFTISDKARCIAGSVVEVICHDLMVKENRIRNIKIG